MTTSSREKAFIQIVKSHYKKEGRDLPWRKTIRPYNILVSEIMLQQTQVDRVIPKYKAFVQEFKNFKTLADAPLKDVLIIWQGLGYNRRAKMLHECAKEIVQNNGGRLPKSHEALVKLPGIGPYTASAIVAFAYNVPTPMIETNIRTVYLHHFFPKKKSVSDRELMHYIEKTMDAKNPREWYWALMDYGSYLKKEKGNQNVRSKHYTKQSKFEGSDRQIRGAILRELSKKDLSLQQLKVKLHFNSQKIVAQLKSLIKEGFIKKRGNIYLLAN